MPPDLVLGQLVLDQRLRLARYNGSTIHLTPIEFCLLRVLLERPGRIIEAPSLVAALWGDDVAASVAPSASPLRHVVYKLRSRLESAGCTDPIIENRNHVGYGIVAARRR